MHGLLESRFHVFGRACHLAVADTGTAAADALELAKQELARLEARFDAHAKRSLVAALSGADPVTVDREAQGLLGLVDALRRKTGNIFDPTILPVSRAWRSAGSAPPEQAELDAALARTGWQNLAFDDDRVTPARSGVSVDLASCLCPYAVDRVHRLLVGKGVASGLVDLDKDIRTIGRQPDGSNWLVGLRHPHGSRTAIHRIKLNQQALSLRGNFERRLLLNGEHFGRTFSPVDGYPVPGLLSLTVTATTCVEAAAAANAGRCFTQDKAIQWLQGLGLGWLAIDRELGCRGPLSPAPTRVH